MGIGFRYGASYSTMTCPTRENTVRYQSVRMGLAWGASRSILIHLRKEGRKEKRKEGREGKKRKRETQNREGGRHGDGKILVIYYRLQNPCKTFAASWPTPGFQNTASENHHPVLLWMTFFNKSLKRVNLYSSQHSPLCFFVLCNHARLSHKF